VDTIHNIGWYAFQLAVGVLLAKVLFAVYYRGNRRG